MEYDEWTNHRQTSKLESAITEPSINFIVSTHSKGKRRPRFALIDKTSLHSIWRSSQSSYHMFRTNGNLVPPEHVNLLVDDLLNLSSHSYNNLRILARKYLLNMIKRWPCLVSKCILSHTENLRNPKAPEYSVLGSCEILASQTVLKHLAMDPKSFSSFILGILSSSHHESLKTRKAINQLFYKFNVHFSGVPRSYFKTSKIHGDAPDFAELVSQISYMSLDSVGLHWRYNLMANRVLLLLAMASRNDPNSSKFLSETAGHFLKNLKSQFPQTRILAISALNTLLKESPYKLSDKKQSCSSGNLHRDRKSSLEGELTQIFQEDGFFSETLNSLSHVHVISGTENSSRVIGNLSFQFLADKSITNFYFDFTSSWPRTPTWVSLFGGDAFYSNYARIFKRLLQECGMPVLATLKSSLEEFSDAKERSKQCVAAEAFAGILHSDIDGISETWNDWMMVRLQKIILAQSVESIPEWTACIRYAITGKGKHGTTVPLLRQPVLDCLAAPLPATVTTTVVVKRYAFLSAALGELSPQKMPSSEIKLHYRLLEELLGNMCHSSAQVRRAIGVTLSVLCSNIRLYESFDHDGSHENANKGLGNQFNGRSWILFLKEQSSEVALNILNITQPDDLETSKNGHLNGDSQADIKWMETLLHSIISSLTSARSSYLVDVIVGFLHPVISLQETSSKELSTLAKAAFELLNWRVFGGPNLQEAISVILSSANDPNWRTRSATLTFLRSFMFRHTFILSIGEKQQIWRTVEKLLVDNKVEVREHAAAVLAGLTKGVDEDLAKDFREKSYKEAIDLQRKRKQIDLGSSQQIASVHGVVLALVASVLSTPYDMPSWLPDHVTLLARFAGEPTPVKSTVTKVVAEFRRTHADTWNIQKVSFTEEQLEVLADTSSSSSYFA